MSNQPLEFPRMFELTGLKALVTGAGRGIGKACVLALASPAASLITGRVLLADAGWTAH